MLLINLFLIFKIMVALVSERPLAPYGSDGRAIYYSWSQKLDNLISQKKQLTVSVFSTLTNWQFQELLAARPHMSEEEQKKIFEAVHTSNLIYRIAEAVGRVNAERGLDISAN